MSTDLTLTEDTAGELFWQWSLQLYGHSDVKDRLLILQNRYQYDVNIVLWCLWTAVMGWRLQDDDVASITATVDDMANYVVRRIREIRVYITTPKAHFPDRPLRLLRDHLLTSELMGEKMIQERLARETVQRLGTPNAKDWAMDALASLHFNLVSERQPLAWLSAQNPSHETPHTLFAGVVAAAQQEPAHDG
ncbi:hypothetical protein PB2503_11764 [Parvularcula bermudensis HTCC2503]|uniref:TIGR02444 family protein n=1 Tax=Parvularcula bermudensis (strain ATCC BAA-594 / HTCC2503 / KCTC 12087) TaxID=314260 RepID=E0TDH1_PARBH|nr:TIGR02444 family protein [Parvularcula bermudensis]ADM10397.1 hypothetical protein PB2503_11764 [Parvularcula bermudensis HTCC2503]